MFAIVKKIHLENLLDHLNKQHSSFRFTVETKRERKLPYLDVRVSRVETGAGRLSMDINRKPTHSSRYLQFFSHHSDNAKSSAARSLFERVSYVTGEEKRKKVQGRAQHSSKVANELTLKNQPAFFFLYFFWFLSPRHVFSQLNRKQMSLTGVLLRNSN